MRKLITLSLFIFSIFIPLSANALLSMELTRGVAGAIPIAVVPFAGSEDAPQNVSTVVAADLQNSGRFKVYSKNSLSEHPSTAKAVQSDYFKRLGTDNVLVGTIKALGDERYQVNFELLKVFHGQNEDLVTLKKQFTITANELRSLAHHISDMVYEQITGVRGVFSTRIAYVVVNRPPGKPSQYTLEVSDQDGYNPRQLLTSSQPIMSPSWSPNGRKIAYVSFENRFSAVYLHDVVSGTRRLLSKFPGINGAPAWSPDGRKLALVLSKSGSPNIYIMDVATGDLKQITNDFYINTEPSWSPNGVSLIFTSNRSGGPQIYQANLNTGKVSRLSYDGSYNARASFTRDGKQVAMIHRADDVYKIALLDLDTGNTRILTNSAGDSASPSIAPNGTMILYDTNLNGRNMLGMVSSDGGVQLVLPARNGQAQDPAWSPFLS